MTEPHDDVRRLAEDYWESYLAAQPTEAHLLGRYDRAGEFEDASREAEDARIAELREFVRRAEAVDADLLDEQDRLTRDVLVSDAGTNADLLEQRLAEVSADPIFGPQISMPIVMGMLALPNAEVADALVDKLRGVGRGYHQLADRHREGAARGRYPAAFAVQDTVTQLDALLATPVADDPLLRTTPPPEGLDVDAWRARLRDAVESDERPGLEAFRDVLRD
ncbi:MAG: DUF885 family protein, partial [Nocardioidaceae bacterium]|nr:DUF885 family protein [Nocardioidaceae bacterium]